MEKITAKAVQEQDILIAAERKKLSGILDECDLYAAEIRDLAFKNKVARANVEATTGEKVAEMEEDDKKKEFLSKQFKDVLSLEAPEPIGKTIVDAYFKSKIE